jgi:hypothetical protein
LSAKETPELLQPTASADKLCFVIAPIGEPESQPRKWSDQVFRHIIQPTVEKMGYIARSAHHIQQPGVITTQIIQNLIDAPLVIADLTFKNPNVFYELAVRHAVRRPYVQLVSKDETIPFDVASIRTIKIDIHDLDIVASAKTELENQIKSVTSPSAQIDSPISAAVDLKSMKESGNPEQRSMADVIENMSEIKSTLAELGRKIAEPDKLLPPQYVEKIAQGIGNKGPTNAEVLREILSLKKLFASLLTNAVKSERVSEQNSVLESRKEADDLKDELFGFQAKRDYD